MNPTEGAEKTPPQKVLVFQQQGSAETKISGIRRYGGDRFAVETISIDETLPPIIDDSDAYLPSKIDADIVLDFLKHPDLSDDLAALCRAQGVPLVASGKKIQAEEVLTPPT